MKPIDYPVWFKIVSIAAVALFALNVAFVAVPMHAFFAWAASKISANELLKGLGTVAASFFGATFAFMFAWYQRRRERIAADVTAGNRALFTLSTMWNVLEQYRKDFVEPARGRHDAWLNFHLGPPLPDLAFDMKDLSFLLKKAGGTFQKLFLEEHRYHHLVFAVEDHRRLLLKETWPRLEEAGIALGASLRPEDEVIKIIGPATTKQLQIMVPAIMSSVDEDLKSLREAIIGFRRVLKKLFPRAVFIEFSF
jgi:hypothetical protein